MLPAAGEEPDDKLRFGAQFEFLAGEVVRAGEVLLCGCGWDIL